jgi:hypothetical protein
VRKGRQQEAASEERSGWIQQYPAVQCKASPVSEREREKEKEKRETEEARRVV